MANSGLKISVSAPGKVILHGEHSVVYSKLAIAASLGLRTKVKLIELEPSVDYWKIELPALNLMHSYALSDITEFLDTPTPLNKQAIHYNWERPDLIDHEKMLQIVESFLCKSAGSSPLALHQKLSLMSLYYICKGIVGLLEFPLKPLAMIIDTELTVSSGSGSSASFAVAVAAAFYQYVKTMTLQEFNVKNGYKCVKMVNKNLKYFDEKELDFISKWAFNAEKIIHGTPSGIDNAICTYGSVVEFRRGSEPKQVQLCEIKLLLVNTNIKRDTKKMVKVVADLKEHYPQIVDDVLSAMEQISQRAIEVFKQINKLQTNSERLYVQIDVELKQCYVKLGELAEMNHHLLQTLGVSHPTLDKICASFKSFDLGGKLTGAGGGGYAFAVIPPYFSENKAEELVSILNSEGFDAVITNLGGSGVTIDI